MAKKVLKIIAIIFLCIFLLWCAYYIISEIISTVGLIKSIKLNVKYLNYYTEQNDEIHIETYKHQIFVLSTAIIRNIFLFVYFIASFSISLFVLTWLILNKFKFQSHLKYEYEQYKEQKSLKQKKKKQLEIEKSKIKIQKLKEKMDRLKESE